MVLGLNLSRGPVHPGEILLEDFIKPLALTLGEVARHTDVMLADLVQIVGGHAPITEEIAGRLRFLGWEPDMWLRLQAQYDLRAAGSKTSET